MMKRLLFFMIPVFVLIGGYIGWQQTTVTTEADATLISLLADENTAGYALALEPNAIVFPRDLGAHDAYQTEWWYYTGNLETADGRPFGYQLTFFRRALQPSFEATDSAWRTNQLYLAHFTISDIVAGDFYDAERFSRGAAGLAGAQAEPYAVWLEDWRVEAIGPETVRLFAQTDEVTLDLTLQQTLPPILHGDGGLSAKGAEPGNASYYYSLVQQVTTGTVQVGDEVFDVTGRSWKDHEYSTSVLTAGTIGWDWFSLQLDNGMALMLFQLRQEDGSLGAESSGSFILADGSVQPITLSDWELEVLTQWTSPETGATYPAAWRLHLPAYELVLEGRPLMPNQELNVSTVYWEGAVSFTGMLAGKPISATGYIEMTGYLTSMKGRL